jgi:hypothetical protein
MRGRNYAIWWTEGDGRRHAGKVELSPFHALLAESSGGRLVVPLDDIAGVDYLLGRPSFSLCFRTIFRGQLYTARASRRCGDACHPLD